MERNDGASDREVERERDVLATARLLCVVATCAYVAFGTTNHAAGVRYDPVWLRALVTAYILGTLGATFVAPRVRRAPRPSLLAVTYVITAHNYLLVFRNGMTFATVIGSVLTLAGFVAVATYVLDSARALWLYLACTAALVLACVFGVPEPEVAASYLLSSMLTMIVLAGFAVHGQLRTLADLRASGASLRADIVQRQKTENDLRASEARATAYLAREAQLQLGERLLSLGTLASGVAHEINNPLTYVISNAQWVADRLAASGASHAAEREALLEAVEGGQRVAQIVADLRDYGAQPPASALAVSAQDAVRKALRLMDHQLRHRCTVSATLAQTPDVLADATRLVQVVSNLLMNAVQAFGDREPSQNRIEVAVSSASAGEVTITVRDNGAGVPEAIRPRIFDPFFTTKPAGVGTGLGLYLCHKFVTEVGGTLSLDTGAGPETTFCVTLPVASAARPVVSLPPRQTAPGRILVIDDDPKVARALCRMLTGYDVTVAQTLREAQDVVTRMEIDAVLCDFTMPEHDGRDVFEALCAQVPSLASRFVFLSGGAFTERASEFLQAPGRTCLTKPIDNKALLAALEACQHSAAA